MTLLYHYAIFMLYMIGGIINLIYPAFCRSCGKKTIQYICKDCFKEIKKRTPPFCIKCGKKIHKSPRLEELCCDCKKNSIYFDRAFSVFQYDGMFKEMIHDAKYRKLSLVKEFMESSVDFIKEQDIAKNTSIVLSIPMHPVRLFKREINLSHILAKYIAKKMNLQYSAKLLKKTKNTSPQTGLKRNERIKNIKGSFSLEKNGLSYIKDKNMLLVDDIFTTGSTVNECARILKDAGASYVEVITLARGDKLS